MYHVKFHSVMCIDHQQHCESLHHMASLYTQPASSRANVACRTVRSTHALASLRTWPPQCTQTLYLCQIHLIEPDCPARHRAVAYCAWNLNGYHRGRYWSGVRAACEPVFHSEKLQTYVPIVNRAMSSLVEKLGAVQAEGPVQINLALAGMTMDVIGGSAFG